MPHHAQPAVPVDNGTQVRKQSKRLQQSQAQVDEIIGLMKVNVDKVLGRDTNLSELDNRADALQEGASQFEKSAKTLKRKHWWKNLKMVIFIGIIILIVVVIIVVWVTSGGSSGGSQLFSLPPAFSTQTAPGFPDVIQSEIPKSSPLFHVVFPNVTIPTTF